MKGNKGHTIVEIVMVLVMLGIMAALASAKYMNSFDQAADQEASTKLNTIVAADEIYHTNSGDYYTSPGSSASLSTTTGINAELSMQLSVTASRDWDYVIAAKGIAVPPSAICVTAARFKNGASTTPCWQLCSDTTSPAKIACP